MTTEMRPIGACSFVADTLILPYTIFHMKSADE
jgi:uncharacterized protein YceK